MPPLPGRRAFFFFPFFFPLRPTHFCLKSPAAFFFFTDSAVTYLDAKTCISRYFLTDTVHAGILLALTGQTTPAMTFNRKSIPLHLWFHSSGREREDSLRDACSLTAYRLVARRFFKYLTLRHVQQERAGCLDSLLDLSLALLLSMSLTSLCLQTHPHPRHGRGYTHPG